MRSRGGAFGRNQQVSFSGMRFRMPTAVLILVIVTAVASIGGAVMQRNGIFPVFSYGALVPARVWSGELWRLVTWPFLQLDPFGLLFALLVFYWFGGELCRAWGQRKFLLVFFGCTVGVAAATTLIGRFLWSEVYALAYLGNWPIAEAMVIAWAVLYPDRQIYVYFVLPVGGKALIAITLVGTTLFALYYGFALFVPHYLAELSMLLYLGQLRRWMLTWRRDRLMRAQKRQRAADQRYVSNVLKFDRRESSSGGDDDDGSGGSGTKPRWLN
jgi:membrane associated rhomboid family serine protease